MIYNEEKRDLFGVGKDYALAHCISADFGMGKGIVVEFNKRFNMKNKLKENFPNFLERFKNEKMTGICLYDKESRVFNLITKERYYQKPTYNSMRIALLSAKKAALKNNVTKIAMPVIGCGLDKLEWDKVSEIIKEVFEDTDIEILVCIK